MTVIQVDSTLRVFYLASLMVSILSNIKLF